MTAENTPHEFEPDTDGSHNGPRTCVVCGLTHQAGAHR